MFPMKVSKFNNSNIFTKKHRTTRKARQKNCITSGPRKDVAQLEIRNKQHSKIRNSLKPKRENFIWSNVESNMDFENLKSEIA